jgi:hypothetical protein
MIQMTPVSRLLLLFAIGVSAVACSTQKHTYVPDGRRGYVINCGGMLAKSSSCLVKAGRACGNRGYDVIKGTEEDGSLLIACKLHLIPPPAEPARQ